MVRFSNADASNLIRASHACKGKRAEIMPASHPAMISFLDRFASLFCS